MKILKTYIGSKKKSVYPEYDKNFAKLASDMFRTNFITIDEKIALLDCYFNDVFFISLPKDKNILELRYGLNPSYYNKPLKYKEIAKIFKSTPANVSYIKNRIFCTVRRELWRIKKYSYITLPALCFNAINKMYPNPVTKVAAISHKNRK